MWKFYRLSTCTAVGTLPRPEDTPSIHARAQVAALTTDLLATTLRGFGVGTQSCPWLRAPSLDAEDIPKVAPGEMERLTAGFLISQRTETRTQGQDSEI